MRLRLLLALVATAFAPPVVAAELVQLSQYEWSHDDPNFGGFSGLMIGENGSSLTAISDRGYYAKAEITRSSGLIKNIAITELTQLPLVKDRSPEEFLIDAEGLTITPDGSIYVSYEGHHRVWKFDPNFQNPEWTHQWDFFWRFQSNSGMEALASDAEGTIYAIPERSGKWERPFPVQRYKDGRWDETLSIPRSERFLVVGADFGPDGKFYLIERDFDVISAFKTRIRRFNLTDSGFDEGETLMETRFSALGNAEGISLWTDANDQTIVTIISDDNFNEFQKTWVTEYILKE